MCSNVIYIAEAHFHFKKDVDVVTWIRKQKYIIDLDTITTDGEEYFVFQFVLGDDMVELYSLFLSELSHNVPLNVTKKFKKKD